VPANAQLRFSIWGQAWSTIDDSTFSNQPTTVNMRIGIDPTGGTNPYSPAISGLTISSRMTSIPCLR
jgi:hypothetical protein